MTPIDVVYKLIECFFLFMTVRKTLSEAEKLDIYANWKLYGNQWKIIGQITGHPATTCATFIKSYQKYGKLFPKRGPQHKITEEEKQSVISIVLGNPEANLKGVSEDTNISTTQCKKILNEAGIHYYERICTPPLTPEHVRKRWVFSNNFANLPYYLMPNIIFSDESTVVVDLDGGGVWRYHGEHPPESFYTKIAHPVQVMVWGAIGPNGYRTKLIQCQGHVNAQKYIDLLAQNHIIDDVKAHFGENFIWMQDNAPSHMAYDAIMWLHQNIPSMLDWPPRSPDLNPIEQLWNYIKRKIKGMNFRNANELFNTLSAIWDSIPIDVIHSIYSSFKARCQACNHLRGECLNGNWIIVRRYHNCYRTKLVQNGPLLAQQFIGNQRE